MIRNLDIIKNFIWRFAERSSAQIVQLIVSAILARILLPSDYGTVALVVVIANIFQVFVDSGLGNALIQKKDVDDLDYSSVFYFNVVWCIILYLILFLLAPAISTFYENPELTKIVRVLCITVVISGVKNVQQAYVSKTLQFKIFFKSTLFGTIVSAIIGIAMACIGYGVWALVFQRLTNLLVDTIVLWFTVQWKPKKAFSAKRLRSLISFGWKLMISALLDTFFTNIRSLVIGKFYTTSDLAYYNQGSQYPSAIVSNINVSIDSVLFPVLSNAQDNISGVNAMLRKSIKVSTYLMAPLMMGLVAVGPTLITIILTEKWLPCVFYLRIFCLMYMFQTIQTLNLNAIKALGRSDIFLKLEIYKKIIAVITLLVTVGGGTKAIAVGTLITSIFSQIINAWPNKKLLNYGYIKQLKDILPNIIMATGMCIVVLIIPLFVEQKLLCLVCQILIGLLTYIVESVLIKNDSFNYLQKLINPHNRN